MRCRGAGESINGALKFIFIQLDRGTAGAGEDLRARRPGAGRLADAVGEREEILTGSTKSAVLTVLFRQWHRG